MTSILLNNIILQPLFYLGAVVLLFLFGWKTKGKSPDIHQYVLIAAPHTSNWDFVFFLLIIFKLRLPVYWMGKDNPSTGFQAFEDSLNKNGRNGPEYQTGDVSPIF